MSRLASWFAAALVWLALAAQVGAPAAAALAMADLADPLAHGMICTANGPIASPQRDSPPSHHTCCDGLCQLAHGGHVSLPQAGVDLARPSPNNLAFAANLSVDPPRPNPVVSANARAPPVAA